MTCGWTGSAARFSERYPPLITEICGHTHFYDEFWQKTTHFLLFFANFWIIHPCLWKICRKMDPPLENLGPKNPPIWAAHTCTHVMYPPPPPGDEASSKLTNIITNLADKVVPTKAFNKITGRNKRKQLRAKEGHKWYDKDCHKLKSRMNRIAARFKKDPFNLDLHSHYCGACGGGAGCPGVAGRLGAYSGHGFDCCSLWDVLSPGGGWCWCCGVCLCQ